MEFLETIETYAFICELLIGIYNYIVGIFTTTEGFNHLIGRKVNNNSHVNFHKSTISQNSYIETAVSQLSIFKDE